MKASTAKVVTQRMASGSRPSHAAGSGTGTTNSWSTQLKDNKQGSETEGSVRVVRKLAMVDKQSDLVIKKKSAGYHGMNLFEGVAIGSDNSWSTSMPN